jgi:hypothetical protein
MRLKLSKWTYFYAHDFLQVMHYFSKFYLPFTAERLEVAGAVAGEVAGQLAGEVLREGPVLGPASRSRSHDALLFFFPSCFSVTGFSESCAVSVRESSLVPESILQENSY